MRLSVYLKRVYLCGKFIGHLRTTYLRTTYLRNSHITPQARIYKAFAGFICTYASPFYKPVTLRIQPRRAGFICVCLSYA